MTEKSDMKEFPEMWNEARTLGAEIEKVAEDTYNLLRAKGTDAEIIQAVLNVVAEIEGWINYLNENKTEKSDLNKLSDTLAKHAHLEGKVVIPLE